MESKRFKSVLGTMAVAVALSLAASAEAATYDLGTVTTAGVTLDSVGLSGSGSFSDVFNFTLGAGTSSQVGVTSFFYGASLADAPTLTLSLNNAPAVMASRSVDLGVGNVGYGYTFTGLQLNHPYSLTLTGSDAYLLGENYSFQIAAVPEPETYGMLLVGLGLIGVIAKRRRQSMGA